MKNDKNGKTFDTMHSGIFDKIKANKRIIKIIALIIIVIILLCIILLNRNNIRKIIEKISAEKETELINLEIDIKEETEQSYKCLLTFTSNDENEKIKSIEYPEQKNNILNIGNEEGKQKIALDYDIEKGKEDNRFEITTTTGKVIEKSTGYTIKYDVNGENVSINNTTKTALINTNATIEETPTREGYTFYGWTKDNKSIISEYENEYKYQKNDKNVTLYAVWRKNSESITAESLIRAVEEIQETCQVTLRVNDENYSADVIVYDEDLNLDGITETKGAILNSNTYEFGNKLTDTAKENEYAKNMAILKVKGDLNINEGITLTACASENGYGGPKGMFIYCTGTLTNNGIISMTARGAKAEGQNVYLYKNEDGSYEYVPAEGCAGGTTPTAHNSSWHYYNANGNSGVYAGYPSRQTGGGGSGFVLYDEKNSKCGSGSNGTSYSGGSGGGSACASSKNVDNNSLNAKSYGGSGGMSWYGREEVAFGGVGNNGGISSNEGVINSLQIGENGTGGLVIIYSNSFNNTEIGKIESNGVGNKVWNSGGSSGGGSINIFYNKLINENYGNVTARRGISTRWLCT